MLRSTFASRVAFAPLCAALPPRRTSLARFCSPAPAAAPSLARPRPWTAAPPKTPSTAPTRSACSATNGAAAVAAGLPKGAQTVIDVYSWAYVNPRCVRFFDRDLCVGVILWFYHRALQREVFRSVARGTGRVLQANSVYGSYIPNLAAHLGPGCRALDVVDVMPIQVESVRRKLKRFPFARAWVDDATVVRADEPYDAVVSYFLHHELPDADKRQATDNLLGNVAPGGRAVFVEYHRMAWWHPLRVVMWAVWALLEPFAAVMQTVDSVRDWASPDVAAKFQWSKRTLFWGMYQVTTARRID
uniref:Putative rhodoquinone biosynthesis methyltransferase-like protein RQUA n=1 Tax=Mastigamoeba balamuthi TaxID=108607 RepID=A0A0K0MDI3_MASBA|nr:putative rhodoquinone biosynthesis methyltransferase-like protein RQUA [Mastigamoeba balamuthi]|eukprot:m51a1_g6782 hypothetical protein (302) ;mRNA; r:136915-137872